VVADLKAQHGGHVVSDEGALWVWTGTHWAEVSQAQLEERVLLYDGATVLLEDGTTRRVLLSKQRVQSTAYCALRLSEVRRERFFEGATRGINCASGFLRFARDDATGRLEVVVEPHNPEHRARHCLRASWAPGFDFAAEMPGSLLETWLEGSVLHPEASPEGDGDAKALLLQEVAGVAALGMGAHFGK